MRRKYHHGLVLVSIWIVLCLLVSDNDVWDRTETINAGSKAVSVLSAAEEQAPFLCRTDQQSLLPDFSEMSYILLSGTLTRRIFDTLSKAVAVTAVVSGKYFLYVPKEERFFAYFQPAIFLCARFLRELLILFKKDGKAKRCLRVWA